MYGRGVRLQSSLCQLELSAWPLGLLKRILTMIVLSSTVKMCNLMVTLSTDQACPWYDTWVFPKKKRDLGAWHGLESNKTVPSRSSCTRNRLWYSRGRLEALWSVLAYICSLLEAHSRAWPTQPRICTFRHCGSFKWNTESLQYEIDTVEFQDVIT